MENINDIIKSLQVELEYHKSLVTLHNKKSDNLRERIKKLKRSKTAKSIAITDHAIVKYMKRFKHDVAGLDIEEVRTLIKDKVTSQALAIGGNGKITLESTTYVIKNHTIVTIYNYKNTE